MKNVSLYFILLFGLYIVVISVRNILIGKGKFRHSMYDNDEKRKLALRNGIIGLILSSVGMAITGYITLMILIK